MVRSFGPGRRARRRAWVGAAVAASALLAIGGSASAEWLAPHDLSPVGNSLGPAVVVSAGATHVAWDRDGTGIEIAEHTPGAGWSEPLQLSNPGAATGIPRLAANAAGDLAAAWYDVNGGVRTIQTAGRPRGGAWSTPVPVPTTRDVSDAGIALAPDGTATATWMELDAGTSLTAIRSSVRPPGGDWSAPVTVSDPTNHSFSPRIVVDRQGAATVLWYQAINGVNLIYASSRPAGGTWSPPELLSIFDWVSIPQLKVAPDGTVLAAWKARDPGLRYTVEVAVRAPGGGWTVRNDLDGGTAAGGNADTPAVAIDDDGDATVVWTRKVGSWNRIQTIAREAGSSTWSAPVTISADDRNAFGQTVAYSPDGNAIAAWYRRNDVNYVVQISERAPDGSWAEPVNLSAASTANLELADLSLVFDADGDPVVSWYRHDGVAGRRVQTTVDDTHGPRLDDLEVPATATPGQSLSFAVAPPVDTWSAPGETTWSFGDGATATGIAAEHAFAAAGTYDVTVAATDALGNRSERTRTVTVAARPVEEPPRRDPPVVDPPRENPPVADQPRTDSPRTDPPRAGPPSTRPRAAVVCRVPKLTGVTLATAKRRLRAANCRLGKVRYVTARRNVGRVVRVSRRAGARLKKGTRVDVTVVRRREGGRRQPAASAGRVS